MTQTDETWRAVPEFPGYQVSSHGRVRSLRKREPKILRADRGNRGHLRATLYRDGKRHMRWVHRLVLEAFVGEPIVLHADDDPTNNRLENLSWGTRAQNVDDARRNGSIPCGEANGKAKLNRAKVRRIRRLLSNGSMSYAAVADRLGVSKAAVGAVARGETWTHV